MRALVYPAWLVLGAICIAGMIRGVALYQRSPPIEHGWYFASYIGLTVWMLAGRWLPRWERPR